MLAQFGYVFLFLVIPSGFVLMNLFVAQFLSPYRPSSDKSKVYDCGEDPIGSGLVQFNMRFYLVALVFVIFDVEIAVMYPVSVVFKELLFDGWGMMAFVEITIFVLILMSGLIYVWSQGGLDWVRDEVKNNKAKN
ncbi:MAG: NADH-quinone oxidoreductase subunit A [SAR324 cluster bacterium]|nr:NADH-quinone oxidoreductase subunit A [SAR324 cluster bacterium]